MVAHGPGQYVGGSADRGVSVFRVTHLAMKDAFLGRLN